MNTEAIHTHKPLLATHLLMAVAAFCGLFALSYPHYRDFIDPDAVAYLTMAQRAAEGDYWRLVNALWSPLHPALVAACVRCGMNALPAAHLTNAAACVLILLASFRLFRRFKTARDIGIPLLLALSVFLTYALYKQLFCDLWQVALLLFYLLMITARDFVQKPASWLLCGIVMALAAYTKVYSFYFLLLHFPLALWLVVRHAGNRKFPANAFVTAFAIQLLMLLPLVLLMHHKYGSWTLSKSGALNTSWTLTGHKSLRPDIHALIPPPYPNSPYTWEDPFISEGALHSRFESLAMMKRQAGHTVLAVLQGVEAAGQISAFLLLTLLATAAAVVRRKDDRFSSGHKVLLLATAIMPLGYLLLHFEARYIWLLLFAGMILGAAWLETLRRWLQNGRRFRLAVLIFAASFIIWPLHDMKTLFHAGADVRAEAKKLQLLGISGTFSSDDAPSRSGLLAYRMNSSFYTPSSDTLSPSSVLADMRRYRVKYYFSYARASYSAGVLLLDERGDPFPEVSRGRIPGLNVFLINP